MSGVSYLKNSSKSGRAAGIVCVGIASGLGSRDDDGLINDTYSRRAAGAAGTGWPVVRALDCRSEGGSNGADRSWLIPQGAAAWPSAAARVAGDWASIVPGGALCTRGAAAASAACWNLLKNRSDSSFGTVEAGSTGC